MGHPCTWVMVRYGEYKIYFYFYFFNEENESILNFKMQREEAQPLERRGQGESVTLFPTAHVVGLEFLTLYEGCTKKGIPARIPPWPLADGYTNSPPLFHKLRFHVYLWYVNYAIAFNHFFLLTYFIYIDERNNLFLVHSETILTLNNLHKGLYGLLEIRTFLVSKLRCDDLGIFLS